MGTTTSTENDIDWATLFDETIPCEIDHGGSHSAKWYAAFGCAQCDIWDTIAVCDEVRKKYEEEFDELTDCICGILQVPFSTFFHGFTPVRG